MGGATRVRRSTIKAREKKKRVKRSDGEKTRGPRVFLETLNKVAKICLKTNNAYTFMKFLANMPVSPVTGKRKQSHCETKDDDTSKGSKKRRSAQIVNEQETKAWKCGQCNKSYCKKGNLSRHVESKHTANAESSHKKKVSQNETGAVLHFKESNQNLRNRPNTKAHVKKVHKKVPPTSKARKSGKPKYNRKKKRANLVEAHGSKGPTKGKKRVSENSSRTFVNTGASDASSKDTIVSEPEAVVSSERIIENGNTSDNQAQTLHATQNTSLIKYICKCGVATESYDASVEHSQRHLALDYTPITNTCESCELTFEAPSFADHASSDEGCQFDSGAFNFVFYDYTKLLTDSWFDMFENLSKSDTERIVSSSLYYHTRSVRINSNLKTGVPLYRCEMCRLFVDPERVENHCKNDDTCAKRMPKGHRCSQCNKSFYTIKALEIHEKYHENGNFKVVTFNYKGDKDFNRALEKSKDDSRSDEDYSQGPSGIQHRAENQMIQERTEQVIDIDYSKTAQFCIHCKKYITCTEFEDHIADHENK